jgi:type II secretory ATPase GspE/PulE/Tfp pilus assembly ATPase PilB-like protein
MLDSNVKVLTGKGGIHQISATLYDYLCLTSDRKLYYNEAYPNHPQVINKIAYFKEAKLFDGKPIPLTSSQIRIFYDDNSRKNLESSQLQREIMDLFAVAASKKVSDLHIIVRKTECVIKSRIFGDLEVSQKLVAAHGHAMCKTIFMTMCDQAGKTFQPKSRQDARIKSTYLPDSITGVRIGTSPTDGGYIMVCRLITKSDQTLSSLIHLGYEHFQTELVNQAKSKNGGINIFAGPTGAGKSKTMAMIIGDIITDSNGSKHVLTAENPVEYEIGGKIKSVREIDGRIVEEIVDSYATQTPVMASNTKRKKEIFSEAIAAMMRLDPDVIMVGEIRDAGSLKAAIDASMTGHQVWTSVHATTAIGIIKRLITVASEGDVSVQKELICDATVISSLMSQRLVKELCPYCAIPFDESVDIDRFNRVVNVFDNDVSGIKMKGKGCIHCDHAGIKGRTAIVEIINCDQKFMELILESPLEAEKYWLEKLKGIPMMLHGLLKVKSGIIDPLDLENQLQQLYLPDYLNHEYFNQLLKAGCSNVY